VIELRRIRRRLEGRPDVLGVAFRLRRRLKESLWVVPFLGAVLGAVLAQLVRWLDQTVQVPPAWQYSASTARFTRLWYRDLLQKLVLATFVGTLTFSFSLLRHVEQGSVPNIGVTVAGGAVAVSMLDASVAECFEADADLGLADASDRQGIGGPPVVPGDRFIPSG
jgi:hypothetical protein